MKNWLNGVSRAVALSLIVIVTVTSCPTVTDPVAPEREIIANVPVIPTNPPEPVNFPDPVEVAVPAFFYMDGHKPTLEDTGRTGFMVMYMDAAKNLVVVSDDRETDDHPIVYFYGVEGVSRVEIHFKPDADFPSGFVIHQEGLPSTTGVLGPYNETGDETFSLELTCDGVFEKYNGLVLNKSLFDAYPGQEDMTGSQYRRVKNILTSLALWTAIAYQTVDAAPSVAGVRDASGAYFMLAGKSVVKAAAVVCGIVAVVSLAVVVLACPPAALIVTSVGTTIVPIVNSVQVVALLVAAVAITGATVLTEIADNMPDEKPDAPSPPPPPPPITINPGDKGPAGGFLLGKLDDGTNNWIEVAPHDIGSFRMVDAEAVKKCEEYSVTVDGTKIGGWYLPSWGELEAIYNLYKAGKINCDGDASYWSSTRANSAGTFYFSTNFYTGETAVLTAIGLKLLVRPVRLVANDIVEDFVKKQLEN